MTNPARGTLSSLFNLDAVTTAAVNDPAQLDRVIPLWLDVTEGAPHPTLTMTSEVISSVKARWCKGSWQLHVFNFVSEAMTAQNTMTALALPNTHCEAGSRATGEGLMLVRQSEDGPFSCQIVDHRRMANAPAPLGSWAVSDEIGQRAALHTPANAGQQRTEQAVLFLRNEFGDSSDLDQVKDRLNSGAQATQEVLASVNIRSVVDEANRLLGAVGHEINCSDRKVKEIMDRHMAVQTPLLVRQLAAKVISEMPERDPFV